MTAHAAVAWSVPFTRDDHPAVRLRAAMNDVREARDLMEQCEQNPMVRQSDILRLLDRALVIASMKEDA